MPSESALRKKVRMIGASDEKSGPRLTANPSRASVVRDYGTGQTFDRKTEVFRKCLKLFKS